MSRKDFSNFSPVAFSGAGAQKASFPWQNTNFINSLMFAVAGWQIALFYCRAVATEQDLEVGNHLPGPITSAWLSCTEPMDAGWLSFPSGLHPALRASSQYVGVERLCCEGLDLLPQPPAVYMGYEDDVDKLLARFFSCLVTIPV